MPRPGTLERWRQRIDRFEAAKMTVTQFCQRQGISQPSFYKWKKTLRELNEQPAAETAPPEVHFVPLRLSDAANKQFDLTPQKVAPSMASTTIELPRGIRIQVEVPTDLTSGRAGEAES